MKLTLEKMKDFDKEIDLELVKEEIEKIKLLIVFANMQAEALKRIDDYEKKIADEENHYSNLYTNIKKIVKNINREIPFSIVNDNITYIVKDNFEVDILKLEFLLLDEMTI